MIETFIKLFLRLCALLPLRGAHALGAAAGQLLTVLPNRSRTVTLTNLALCFPELPPRARRRLAVRSLRQMGRTATETGALWYWEAGRVLALARAVSGREAMDQALRAGKGGIILTPHLGNWEMIGLYCSAHYPLTSLYRPPRLQGLEDFMRSARERAGARLVPTNAAGVRYLYRALASGEFIGMLPDQEPAHGNGIFAPFFGIPAYTMSLLARLVQKTGAPVFFAYAERLAGGAGFHLHFTPAPQGFARGDVEEITAAMNIGVEACVRRIPEQYQWSYRRFRTRPEGAPRLY